MSRIAVTVDGKPAIVVGYAPGPKGQPLAILISDSPTLLYTPVSECHIARLPKRLLRAYRVRAKRATREVQETLADGVTIT